MSDADIGYLAKLGIEGETPGEFPDLGVEITRIKPVGWSRDEEEVTHLQSPDGFKEFIAGMKEATPCEFDINWKPSQTDPVLAAFEKKSNTFQITAPNGVRMQFPGFVTSYEPGDLSTGTMTATVTIRPTAKPVLLAASGV